MKDHPIIFSTEMVRAILEGKKTMTRRLSGLKKVNDEPYHWKLAKFNNDIGHALFLNLQTSEEVEVQSRHQIGGHLWVKETYWHKEGCEWSIYYKADFRDIYELRVAEGFKGWKSSMFMPKRFARLWLEIIAVKVGRLQDISEKDAQKEGVISEEWKRGKDIWWQGYRDEGNTIGLMHQTIKGDKPPEWMLEPHRLPDRPDIDEFIYPSARQKFVNLWDSSNGKKYPWKSNPWVWVYTFRRIK